MLRIILCLLLALHPAAAAQLVREPHFAFARPDTAKFALIWSHGTYGREENGPPPPPDFVARQAAWSAIV